MHKLIGFIRWLWDIPVFFGNAMLFALAGSEKPFKTAKSIRGLVFLRCRGRIKIGNNVRINSRYSSNPIGGQTFMSIVVQRNGILSIGDNTGISNSAIFCSQSISIGNNVFIGGDCRIFDTDFHSLNLDKRIHNNSDDIHTSPVEIMDGAFLGAGCVVLKGSRIGVGSVIGAGSIVAGAIPENEIWAGNPCRFIRKVSALERNEDGKIKY